MTNRKEPTTGLRKLLADQLADSYYAEKQLVKALPKMAKAATNDELRTAFEQHLEETVAQVGRLEEVFGLMGIPVKGMKCLAIDGILEEGKEVIEEFADDAALDAGLVAAAQKVEHYEMASYGCMVAWAEHLDMDDVASLLRDTLEEEKGADAKLSAIAETVNAAAEGDNEEEGELAEAGTASMRKPSSQSARSGNKGPTNGGPRKTAHSSNGKIGGKR